jgi:hypothetical protein
MFVYSAHTTREQAEATLREYFANGEVREVERPRIERHPQRDTRRWCVLFPDA